MNSRKEKKSQRRSAALCGHCHYEKATLPNDFTEEGDLCADCFWNIDAARKKERRADPTWRFGRAYSFAVTCLGFSKEEALAIAATSATANKNSQ